MSNNWDKKLSNWEKYISEMENLISEITEELDEYKEKYRGVKRIIDGKNFHIIRGSRQNRLKINWRGKSFWFHLPHQDYEDSVMKIRSDFINKILRDEIR
jgi:hypothetical protein